MKSLTAAFLVVAFAQLAFSAEPVRSFICKGQHKFQNQMGLLEVHFDSGYKPESITNVEAFYKGQSVFFSNKSFRCGGISSTICEYEADVIRKVDDESDQIASYLEISRRLLSGDVSTDHGSVYIVAMMGGGTGVKLICQTVKNQNK